MDHVVEWILGVILAAMSALMGLLYNSHDRLREKQAAFETATAARMVYREDLLRIEAGIAANREKVDEKLDKILDKLDDKADKPGVR